MSEILTSTPYHEFLRNENDRTILVEFDSLNTISGATVTRRVANRTATYDNGVGAILTYLGILQDMEIDRSMGSVLFNPAIVGGGEIVIENADGRHDFWLSGLAFEGQRIEMWMGLPDWTLSTIKTNQFFSGRITRLEFDEQSITVFFHDKNADLKQPILSVLETLGVAAGGKRPICYGYPKNIPGVLVLDDAGTSPATPEYRIHESGTIQNAAVTIYIDQKASTTPSATKHESSLLTQVRFTGEPNGLVTFDSQGKVLTGPSPDEWLVSPGEILRDILTRKIQLKNGIIRGADNAASPPTVQLDLGASLSDDEYNTKSIRHVKLADKDGGETRTIDDYVGSTRTATVSSAFTTDPVEGDFYEIVSPPTQSDAGPLEVADLRAADFSQYDSDVFHQQGIYIDNEDDTAHDVLKNTLGPGSYYWWTRDGKLSIGILEDPSSGTPALGIDEWEIIGQVEVQSMKRVWRVRVGYDRNYTHGSLATGSNIDSERAAFVRQEYRFAVVQDETIRDQQDSALDLTWYSYHTKASEAQDEAKRIFDLYSVDRRVYTFKSTLKPMAVNLNAIVNVDHPRFALDNKQLMLFGIIERPLDGTTEIQMWG